METKTKSIAVRNINKPAYIIFVLAGIYFLIIKDFSQAAIFWGISLAFDPFNTAIPFQKRSFYQQALLIIHLAIAFTVIALMLLGE
jgi:hypothetical protein